MTTNRRQFLARTAAVALTAAGCPCTAAAQAKGSATNAELMKKAETPIKRGLEFLASAQHEDGSFSTGAYGRNAAVCSLAGLAFLAGGNTPDRGPYGRNVGRCLDFLLEHTNESGLISVPGAVSHGPMYGHGFATLFIAECYGMSQRTDIRKKLSAAVNLIVNTQNADGGWRYQPQAGNADISVTACEIMALRAARNAGIFVPKQTRDRCIDYVKRCQNADGGFRYMLTPGPVAFPRSAAAVVALYTADVKGAQGQQSPEIKRGIKYLLRNLPNRGLNRMDGHYFYGHYYAVQAMWHAGGDAWQQYYPAIRDQLIKNQIVDGDKGFWKSRINREYATGMACIILQVPNNYLPILQPYGR